MPISAIPKFLQKAFAANGAKTDIPLNADLVNGRAGYTEGFPPITMTAVAAGGIPPAGQDFNGILYDLSAAIQYAQSGMRFPFDATFATSIGGYGVGAIVSDATDKSLLWINGTSNNTAFPAGWTQVSLKQATESVQGTLKISTQDQANSGVDDATAITPKKMRMGFSASFAASGSYVAFPTWLGGWIIQFGSKTFQAIGNYNTQSIGGATYYTNYNIVDYPIAFSSTTYANLTTLACAVFASQAGMAGKSVSSNLNGNSSSLTRFDVAITTTELGYIPTVHWLTIGK